MIRKYISNLVLILLCTLPLAMFAQGNDALVSVSAAIADLGGRKIENANIVASNSKQRSVTDNQGKFEIKVSINDFLVINAIGFERLVIPVVGGKVDPVIILAEFGAIDAKKHLTVSHGMLPFDRTTGSVERITGDELKDYPTISTQEAIGGRVSGVRSSFGETSPEIESFGNSIRGSGFGAIYIDGVPSSLTETPAEIDDIIIAKDLGSTMLFGGDAADGAMIINTKKGLPGDRSIKFTLKSGLRGPVFLPDMMDAQNYAINYNTALSNDGFKPIYSQQAIDGYASGKNPVVYPSHQYYDELVNNTASYQNFAGDFSGGNKLVRYFSHLGYYSTNGIESVGNGRNSSQLRMKNNVEINFNEMGKLSLGIGGSFTNRKAPLLSGNDLFNTMYQYPANAMPYMLNDSVYSQSTTYGTNLLSSLKEGSIIQDLRRDAYTRLALDLDLGQITKGLSFNSTFSLYSYNNLQKRLDPIPYSAEPIFTPSADSVIVTQRNFTIRTPDTQWSQSADAVSRTQYLNSSLNYDRQFGVNHGVIANIVFAQRNINGNASGQEDRMRNIGGRVNYYLKQKYTLEANFVNSTVRQLSQAERSKLFFSTGIAWLAHKELFLKDISWINYLKLRANYGIVGLPGLGDVPFFLSSDSYIGASTGGTFGVVGTTTTLPGTYTRTITGSDHIAFPKQSYLNIGADFELAGSKIRGQINYFRIRRYDILLNPTNLYAILPGAYLPYINYGDSRTSGFDGRISYRNKLGEISYNLDANAEYRTSYVSKSNSVNYPESERNDAGNLGGRIIGLESDGIFQTQGEIDSSIPQMFGAVKPGDIRYKDFNNDGVIDEKDYHQIGKSPRLYYALNVYLKYKNWKFSLHGDGVAGGKYVESLYWNRGSNNYPVAMSSSWPVSNELPRLTTYSGGNNYRNSNFWIKSASYFSLKSFNLGYQIPSTKMQKIGLKEATIYLAGKNLFVLSSAKDRYMPGASWGYSSHALLNAFELGLELSF